VDARSPGAWQALFARQARDFAAWPVSGDRFVDEAACLAAVLLAVCAACELRISNVGWAAFSAYMVIRPGLGETLYRGGSRVVGTAAGVMLARLLAPAVLHSSAWTGATLALFGGTSLYLALLDRRAYGALFAGMAFAMVLIDGMESPGDALGALARARFLDVCVGRGAALLVSAITTLALRRDPAASYGRAQAARRAALRPWHPAAFMHALQGAIALALIPWVWTALHVRSLSQSSTTIMAVMMVPLLGRAASSRPASRKMRHRFIGCGIGAVLTTGILMLSHGSPLVMTLAVCAGVLAGRHIENGALDIGYVGTQFALAFLVVLVPDSGALADVHAGLSRLSGIVVGIGLLQPVQLLVKTRLSALRQSFRGKRHGH
jgi:uncharacterized membrane protein YccC